MVNAKSIVFSILDQKRFLLSWENVGDSTAAQLAIERSDSPDSDFSELATVGDTENSYIDTDPPTHRKYIPYYYRIKHADGTYSEIVHLPFERNNHLLQYIFMLNRYLKRDVGLKSYYFHFKRSGILCDCWSKQLKESTVKNCPICNGTGRKEGYGDPVELYVSYPPDSPTEISTGHTTYQVLAPQAWTSNYPLLFPEDIIIRNDDKEVFIIQGEVRRSGRKLYPGRQVFNVQGVEHGSIQYNLIDRIPAA